MQDGLDIDRCRIAIAFFVKRMGIVLCFIFYGCAEAVDLAVPDSDPLVLIYGFIAPEVPKIRVSVSETRSLFRPGLSPEDKEDPIAEFSIPDADVRISDSRNTNLSLLYNTISKHYEGDTSDLNIQAGENYFLRVVVDGQVYTATCTIPVQKISEINTRLGYDFQEDNLSSPFLRIEFLDIPNASNYYIVGAEYRSPEDLVTEPPNKIFFGAKRFLSDGSGDGFLIRTQGIANNIDNGIDATIQLAHVEESMFTTLFASFNNPTVDNPFSSPIISPSNIKEKGGFGVFAGYRLTTIVRNIPFQDN